MPRTSGGFGAFGAPRKSVRPVSYVHVDARRSTEEFWKLAPHMHTIIADSEFAAVLPTVDVDPGVGFEGWLVRRAEGKATLCNGREPGDPAVGRAGERVVLTRVV